MDRSASVRALGFTEHVVKAWHRAQRSRSTETIELCIRDKLNSIVSSSRPRNGPKLLWMWL